MDIDELAAPDDDLRRRLSSLFAGMMKSLFKEDGSEFRVGLVADTAVQEFVGAHASALDSAFQKVEMSEAMRRRLTRSNYIFSGMKAFHELHEAFPSLLDENGNRKPFDRFLNDVRSIEQTYNANYLRAEYNFVAASAEMAGRWEQFMRDGDRYNLQYRTQKDDKVRPEHAALDRVTLSLSDSFWEEFYPPNGWNCFPGSTPVLTAAGWKFIKDIKPGDLVVGGSGKYRAVIAVHSREVDTELVRICTKGTFATCTENHRFLSARGWKTAGELEPFDILIQVSEISALGKLINAINNTATLGKYLLVSLKRKWKSVSPPAINGDVENRDKEINDIGTKQLALLEPQSHCCEAEAYSGLGFALGLVDGTHPFGMLSTSFKRIGQSLRPGFRAKERCGSSEFLRNTPYKRAVRLVLALPHMLAGLCKRAIGRSKSGCGLSAPQAVVPPLCPDSLASLPDRDSVVNENTAHGSLVDTPMVGQPSETALLDKVPRLGGIDNPAALNGFNSVFDFLRQSFFHTRYSLVEYKDTTNKSKTTVFNLSVNGDESYIVPIGIAHNCRCTVVQVRKSKYPETSHDEAMRLGDEALQRDTKGIFRFNAGKEGKSVPDYNPYTIHRCSTCPIAKGGKGGQLARSFVPDNEVCAACALVRQCEQLRGEVIKHGKGTIEISHLVDRTDGDYERLLSVARHFAADGARVVLTPKMTRPAKFEYDCVYGSLRGTPYDGKCPDLKIDGLWYEHEGFVTDNPKRAFSNMVNHGLKQSDRIIIDRPDLTDRFMLRSIHNRIRQGIPVEEVWLRNSDGSLSLLYKKTDG